MPSNTTSSVLKPLPNFSYCKEYENNKRYKFMKNTKRREAYLRIHKGHKSNLKNLAIQTLKEAFGTGS